MAWYLTVYSTVPTRAPYLHTDTAEPRTAVTHPRRAHTALYVSYPAFCLPPPVEWSVYHQPATPPVVYKLGVTTRSRRMAASSSSSFLASSASPSSRAAARTCAGDSDEQ